MPSQPISQRAARSRALPPLQTYDRETPEFAAWIGHWRDRGYHVLARDAESLGYVRVRERMPPTDGGAS